MMDGILCVDKSSGWTSHDVVAHIRRLLGRSVRVGHSGTLDPLATGVLVVCLGRATRVSRFVSAMDKEYEAQVRLGIATESLDAWGRITAIRQPAGVTEEAVRSACLGMEGTITQTVPMLSAVKVGGERLHRLARRGERIDPPRREVTIYDIEVQAVTLPTVSLRVRCSSGTYLRTLAADLGNILGCGGHLSRLRRTAVGHFSVKDSLAMGSTGGGLIVDRLSDRLLQIGECLRHLPAVTVDEQAAEGLRHGVQPRARDLVGCQGNVSPGDFVRVMDLSGVLLAIARSDVELAPMPRREGTQTRETSASEAEPRVLTLVRVLAENGSN